jgi:hypothetical protein
LEPEKWEEFTNLAMIYGIGGEDEENNNQGNDQVIYKKDF